MSKIVIDIEGLTTNAANLAKQISDLDALIDRFNSLLEKMLAGWTGAASDAYQAMLRRNLEKAKKQREAIQAVQEYITKVIEEFRDTDDQGSTSIHNSF